MRRILRKKLVNDWNTANTSGYDPKLTPADDLFLSVHLGEYDESMPFPQIGILGVSSTGSIYGSKGDGSGLVMEYNDRYDITVYTGSKESVPEAPDVLAADLGDEVNRIMRQYESVLTDGSGNAVAENLVPSRPVVRADPDFADTRWFATVEIQLDIKE